MVMYLLVGCSSQDDKLVEDSILTTEDDSGEVSSPEGECDGWITEGPTDFVAMGTAYVIDVEPCTEQSYFSAASSLSQLKVQFDLNEMDDDNLSLLEYRVEDLLGMPLVDWTYVGESETDSFQISFTGEFIVKIRLNEPEKSTDLTIDLQCLAGCDAEFTRYPIVFMHGLAGFDTLLNVVDYWVGVEDLLVSEGYSANVYGVSAFDPTPVRAEQWAAHLEALHRQTGARKLNLIAHSQGGLDARYYSSILDLDNRVASITTIATPHDGTAVAELLSNVVDLGPSDGQIVDALVSGAAELFGTTGDSFSEQLAQMTPDNMALFNDDVPNVSGVEYYSWGGKSCRYLQWSCQSQMEGETVSSYFLLSHAYLEGQEGDNDGLVSVASSEWGTFLGVLPADHIDEVGHRFDLSAQPFDAAEFYLSEARRLAAEGF